MGVISLGQKLEEKYAKLVERYGILNADCHLTGLQMQQIREHAESCMDRDTRDPSYVEPVEKEKHGQT